MHQRGLEWKGRRVLFVLHVLPPPHREVADHVQNVSPSDGITSHHGNHRLREPANLNLNVWVTGQLF